VAREDDCQTHTYRDDERDIVRTTTLALELEGYQVIPAGSGQEALGILRTMRIDLIILDIMLPDLDGNEVARILKSDREYRHIPIIVVSALSQRSEGEAIRKTGVECYLKKPFELAELSDKIKELLSGISSSCLSIAPKDQAQSGSASLLR